MLSRTPSEAKLASLHLDFTRLTMAGETPSNTAPSSRVADEDLEGLELPSLGQSVVEEQEEQFVQLASKALSFLATPESSDRPEFYSPFHCSPLPDCDVEQNLYFATRRNFYHNGSDSWTPRSFSSSSSSSADDSGYSSPASSCDAPSSPTLNLKVHSTSTSPPTSLAARRGKPMAIAMPSNVPSTNAEPTRTARKTEGFSTGQEGVLKNNFAGVSLSSGGRSGEAIEGPLSPALRRKPRSHGFAF